MKQEKRKKHSMLPERMQPYKMADQKVQAEEMDKGGRARIYGLGVPKRCSS